MQDANEMADTLTSHPVRLMNTLMSTSYKPHGAVVFTQLRDGEGVLLQLDSKLYYGLNASGLFLWKTFNQENLTSREHLVSRLMEHYQISEATAQQDVDDFLKQMLAENLIEDHA